MIEEVQVYLLCFGFDRCPVWLECYTNKILLQCLLSAASTAQRLGSNVVGLLTEKAIKKKSHLMHVFSLLMPQIKRHAGKKENWNMKRAVRFKKKKKVSHY